MSFLKKLTRSRASSYVDDDYDRYEREDLPDRGYEHPPTSFRSLSGPYDHIPSPSSAQEPRDSRLMTQPQQQQQQQQQQPRMYTSGSGSMRPQDLSYQNPNNNSSARSSGVPVAAQTGMSSTNRSSRDGFVDVPPVSQPMQTSMSQQSQQQSASSPSAAKMEQPTPDLLTRAFNEVLKPYTDKIEQLEQQVSDMQLLVDQLEQQRLDIYTWIDKRGLRPDVPPEIAKQMDSTSDAANALNAQLDRKITIVNFDLHRLQDDLNDSISSAHFASAMSKFLPDIQRLTVLPSGPRYAYELVIKLVGNLNSHGGLEATREGGNGADERDIAEDRAARQSFYERMDEEMVEIVNRRGHEGEDWPVGREIKRLEKNAAYLKNLGIEPYFPRTLDAMRQLASSASGFPGGQNTPPRYSDGSAPMPLRTSMQK